MKLSPAKKSKGEKCCAFHCHNAPVQKLGGLCYKHYRRKRRKLDPVGIRYQDFTGNARKRGIPCNVTLKEFRQFCVDNDYIVVKGQRGRAATIDRIRNNEGYYIGNMQILSLRANVKKYNTEDRNAPDFVPF